MKKHLYAFVTRLAQAFGSDIMDYHTGRKIARAFMVCFAGRVYLFGLQGTDQVIPIFLPQKRMSFWKREIGFTVHPAPDFPSEPASTT